MVQKQAALSGGYRADSFADDDPLAELARIVGFEQPRSSSRQEPELRVPANAPPLNLEDELLREFETFDEPAPARREPSEPAPLREAPRDYFQPAVHTEPPARSEPVFREPEPVFDEPLDWAAELAAAEFVEPPRQEPVTPMRAASAPVARQPVRPPPIIEPERPAAPEAAVEPFDDLMGELEMAFAANEPAPVPAAEPRLETRRPEPSVAAAPAPRLSLPIANFPAPAAPRREPEPPAIGRYEPQEALDSAPVPSVQDTPSSTIVSNNLWPELEAAFWTTHGELESKNASNPQQFETRRAARPERVDPGSAPAENLSPLAEVREPFLSDLDFSFAEELAASEEFAPVVAPVRTEPDRADRPASFPAFAPPIDLRVEEPVVAPARPAAPAFVTGKSLATSFGTSRPAEPAFGGGRQVEPAFASPRAAEPRFSEIATGRPPASTERELDPDMMADSEFELMLDDLELDLSEFDTGDTKVETGAVSPRLPPAPAAPARAPVAPAFGARQATPALAPAAAGQRSAAAALEQRLPFDPLDIVETEDHPETVAMPDVPEMPAAEPAPSAPRQDFDYDLDAELAGLLQMAPPVASSSRTATPSLAPTPPAAKASPSDDFDDFERALEEDFRRSLAQPQQQGPLRGGRISINQLTPADAVPEGGGRRWMLLASTVALVLVAGSVGAYLWMSGTGSSMLASDEPRVITADKDPIKVAPENPGGKSVPNQDKAVYDRVAGQNVADPKQPSLISSNEEPMDVVQRTLMPENLDNDEVPLAVTPVGETEDPRLLPGGTETANAASGEADQSAIAPRKVRTMIVKPDGTLVAQEVPAPVASGPVASPSGTPTSVTAPAPALAAPSQPASASAAVPAPETPSAAPSGTQATTPAAQAATPVPPETAAAAPSSAPVPVSRPAQQPVNVVGTVTDQGNVRGGRVEPATPPAGRQAPAAPAAAASVAPGEYVIQIASLPSEAEAEKSYRNLSGKFAGVIGGRGYEIKAAEVAGKGTYYRVRIAAGSKAEADALCARFKAAGGSCLVAR